MKTNLDKMFKNNSELEDKGLWLLISEEPEIGFLVRRFGGENESRVKAAMAKYYKPYARLIQNESLPAKKEKELVTKIFVDSCLVDWKGIEVDGSAVPYSKEKAIELLLSRPELLSTLQEYASDTKNYREDLGNF